MGLQVIGQPVEHLVQLFLVGQAAGAPGLEPAQERVAERVLGEETVHVAAADASVRRDRALGPVIGLALAVQLSLRKACAMGSAGGSAAAAGSGIAATLAASSTGILGCCGSALSGGVLALAGVSFTTASQIAEISPWIQIVMIGFFAFAYVRLSRRLKVLSAP